MATTDFAIGSATWNIDSAHSSIDFSVKHMGVFTVRGKLGTIAGAAETKDGELTAVALKIDASGISTNNEQRDAHLRSGDFFKAEQNPTITFQSTAISKLSDAEYKVTGDLTIAGATKPVEVNVEIVSPVKDPWGMTRSGGTGSGSLSRKEWGLTYNSLMDTGHLMIRWSRWGRSSPLIRPASSSR